jgi:hypothetical protein
MYKLRSLGLTRINLFGMLKTWRCIIILFQYQPLSFVNMYIQHWKWLNFVEASKLSFFSTSWKINYKKKTNLKYKWIPEISLIYNLMQRFPIFFLTCSTLSHFLKNPVRLAGPSRSGEPMARKIIKIILYNNYLYFIQWENMPQTNQNQFFYTFLTPSYRQSSFNIRIRRGRGLGIISVFSLDKV